MARTNAGIETTYGVHAAERGLAIERRFTREGVHPFDELEWDVRDAVIGDPAKPVFEQREVELERRLRVLERRVSEFAQRRRRLLDLQDELEAGRRRKWDHHLLKAAQLEQQAEQRLTETALWVDEFGACEAEMQDMLRALDSECRQLDSELNELSEARSASQAQ